MDNRSRVIIAAFLVVAAGVGGYFVGHEVGEPDSPSLQRGTVFSVDDGEVCIELTDDEVECYRAMAREVEVGQEVTFVATSEPIDPANVDGGKVLTLVYIK